ncbi:hypothetical protein FRB96_009647 [Tulasnella sp. 330]|nr:hypothetical protein FRB96_009647 [Tulasnella sp. 330]
MDSTTGQGMGIQSYVSAGEGATPRPCFVRDVLAMKEAGVKDWSDIFWLGAGKVPLRWVVLVGLIVGVMAYEKRVLYTRESPEDSRMLLVTGADSINMQLFVMQVDDGTDVVDCIYQIPKQLKPSKQLPTPPAPRGTLNSNYKSLPSLSLNNVSSKAEKTRTPYDEAETGWSTMAALVRPDIEVGTAVRVVGKVSTWRDGKQLIIETIIASTSSLANTTTPGRNRVKPTQSRAPTPYSSPITPRPTKRQSSQRTNRPSTPPTTPPKVSLLTSSFDVDDAVHETPRLRHPTKLSSSQLTPNTFRIHVARYMELAARYHTIGKGKLVEDDGDDLGMGIGFSLSYLRRVPEIDALGRKVVEAEAKRRAKKERDARRQKEKENDVKKVGSSSSRLKDTGNVASQSSERTSLKVKRLLEMTLRTLREDGAIILVEGPGRRWKSTRGGERKDAEARRKCWRDATMNDDSLSTSFANTTRTSTMSTLSRKSKPDSSLVMSFDDDPPSSDDPDANPIYEESFVPITPAVLAPPVLCAMKRIFGPYPSRKHKGVTVEDVTKRLRRDDETWVKVLEEHVERALESLAGDDGEEVFGDGEGKTVWRMGGGRWGLYG